MSDASEWSLEESIDDEGAIEEPYQDIETFYAPLEAVLETEHYLRVVGDNGGNNVEIRIPVEQLVLNGWTLPADYAERIRSRENMAPPLDWAEIGEDGTIIRHEPSEAPGGSP